MLFLCNLFSGCEFQNSFSYFKKLFKLSRLYLKSVLLKNITTDKFAIKMCDWKMSWSVGERKLPLTDCDFKWLNFLRRFAKFFLTFASGKFVDCFACFSVLWRHNNVFLRTILWVLSFFFCSCNNLCVCVLPFRTF